MIDGWGISFELALRWMSLDLTDDKSTLVQVMAWCRQATSHYLSQCWPRSLTLYDVTRPQWVNCILIQNQTMVCRNRKLNDFSGCSSEVWWVLIPLRWWQLDKVSALLDIGERTLMISQHWLWSWIDDIRQQVITWTSVDPCCMTPYGITRPQQVNPLRLSDTYMRQ